MSKATITEEELIKQSSALDEPLIQFLSDISAKNPELRTVAVGAVLLTYGMQMYAGSMSHTPDEYMKNVIELAMRIWMSVNPEIPLGPPEES